MQIALALAWCATTVPLAQGVGQQPRPSFSSSVDIVSVDVHVIDHDGRPVRDLRAGDFALMVDGRPRTIASAQFISVTAPVAAATPAAAATAYTTNVGVPQGRLIAVVIDRGSIAPLRAKDVLAAAARFVSNLRPEDRVGLFSIPTGPAVDFTTEHDSVVSAIQRTDGTADPHPGTKHIGIADALGFEHGNSITIDNVTERECGVMNAGRGLTGVGETALCVKLVREEAGIVASYAHERARNTIAGLLNILERLGTSETPKTIVMVSEGLVLDGERNATATLARAIAAAHATIYTLKPESSESDASQARAPEGQARDRAVHEEGLESVSRLGGGDMFRVLSDPDFAFGRLATELSGYYLLGFEPEATDRDGKPHAISVKVEGGGLSVRSRPDFTVGAHQSAQAVIADLLRTPVAATQLPIRLTTYAFQDPESPKIRLLVAMEVERSGDPNAHMALGLVLVKPGGEVGATFFQPAIDAPAELAKPQKCFATLLVEPGNYTLRAAVMDSDGRRGSVERPVRAYMTRIARFRATELLIGDDEGSQPAAGGVVPTVSGDITAEELHTYFELFSDAPGGFEGTAVTVEVLPAGSSTPVETAQAALVPVGTDDRCRAAAGSVPVKLLPGGSYLARAIVTLDGRKVGQMTRPFRVKKP